MSPTIPKLSNNAMIQMAKDYLTRRRVELTDMSEHDYEYYDIKVWHDPDFDFWHQVRFIDRADKTLGWIVEVCWVCNEWRLSARCLPYALPE